MFRLPLLRLRRVGAGERIRTVDNHVGNVTLYQLSYARKTATDKLEGGFAFVNTNEVSLPWSVALVFSAGVEPAIRLEYSLRARASHAESNRTPCYGLRINRWPQGVATVSPQEHLAGEQGLEPWSMVLETMMLDRYTTHLKRNANERGGFLTPGVLGH